MSSETSCSCHINPPCSYCVDKCAECGEQNCEEHFIEEVEQVANTPITPDIFSEQKFYYVDSQNFQIKECRKRINKDYLCSEWIRPLKMDGTPENYSHGACVDNLFDNEFDAINRASFLKKLYLGTFREKPFLKSEILIQNLDKLIFIESAINKGLEDYENFESIDFCDVSAGGIQIRGRHKLIKNYTYGNQPTIKYDFSNFKECIKDFLEDWKAKDNPEYVKNYQGFLREGERYNWN